MIGRMRKLERLGLAEPLGPARWRFSDRAEPTLRALGERDDIIKRIHRGLTEQRIERSIGDFALHDGDSRQVIGRLIAFGLDDELKESVYAVIDGVDGRVHHLGLPDLNAVGDATPGSIVELAPVRGCGEPPAHRTRSAFRPAARETGRRPRSHMA
jgi:type IV secretory pathway VirD2 relaxase